MLAGFQEAPIFALGLSHNPFHLMINAKNIIKNVFQSAETGLTK